MNDSTASSIENLETEASASASTQESSSPSFSEDSSFLDGLMGATEKEDSTSDTTTTSAEETTQDEPAPKETETDPDLADLPKTASERTKADWKKAKEAKRAVESERDKLKAELEELRRQPASTQNTADIEAVRKELESYKQRLESYEQEMAVVDVTRTEEYRTNIAQPLAVAEQTIQEFASKYELSIPQIAAAAMKDNVLERNALLAEMAANMNEFDKMDFRKTIDDARSLYLRSEKAKAEAKNALKFVEEKRQKEMSQKQEQEKTLRSEASKKVWDSLTKTLPESLRSDEKAMAALAKDAIESDILSAPPEIQAYATQAAVLLPTYKTQLDAAMKEIADLKASIAKRSGAMPKAKSGSIPVASGEDEPADFMSGLDAAMNSR